MRGVGLKGLKNKLGEYVRRVVAELAPSRAHGSALLADPVLAELVRRGVLTPAVRPFAGPPPRGKPVMQLAELLAELDQDRNERG